MVGAHLPGVPGALARLHLKAMTGHLGFIAVALLVCSATTVAQQPGASPAVAAVTMPRDSLQRIVSERVQGGRSTGLIVGVLTPTGARYVVTAGNERKGKPLDIHSIFEIGSITKVFTGILLAEMVNRGEVQPRQRVTDLLPPGTKVPSRGGREITLLDLSTQTSGLPRLPSNLKPQDPTNPYADYSVAQLYEFLSGYELPRDPGAQYEYSNLGVGLLGHALALRAGKSYEELVRERILGPLGMTRTGIALNAEMRAHLSEGHDRAGQVVPLWDLPTLAGAGALRSSLDDMMRFVSAVLDPPDNAIGRAIALSQETRFNVNQALALGLNWHRSVVDGDTMVWHNGGTAGFRTFAGVNPRTRTAVVLLGNSGQDNDDISRHILIRNFPLATFVARKEITISTDALRAYEGTYRLAPQFALNVRLEGGSLIVQATDQPKFRLFAEAPDKFFLKDVEAQLEFGRDASGEVTSVTLVQGGRTTGLKEKRATDPPRGKPPTV